ncbi:MAG: GNAT family N-acetyltransferase [Oscillospiraceae bacterium]|nr:GNAT family N-acetyltransferase [Oscillospiraceae bacterium]
MNIINSHDITLTRGSIALRPLCDDHLPLLYRWNSDPEVHLALAREKCFAHKISQKC